MRSGENWGRYSKLHTKGSYDREEQQYYGDEKTKFVHENIGLYLSHMPVSSG